MGRFRRGCESGDHRENDYDEENIISDRLDNQESRRMFIPHDVDSR